MPRMLHPDDVQAGEITRVYQYIAEKVIELGLQLRCEGTYQTKQIYVEGVDKPMGAIQYEGSNNFEEKLPDTVSLRFNRLNIPERWKVYLEEGTAPYKKVLKTVITYKFTSLTAESYNDIDELLKGLGFIIRNVSHLS